MVSFVLSYVAGLLSTLSPCVLPIIPLIVGASLKKHRLGPLFMAGGLAVSFTVVGLFVSTIGFNLGLRPSSVRLFSGVILVVSGLFLVSTRLQQWSIRLTAPLAAKAQTQVDHQTQQAQSGLRGQFWIGALLGAVWSPCVGPTLGVAFALASQGQDLFFSGVLMFLFGLGAATPLIGVAYMAQGFFAKRRQLSGAADRAKRLLGWLLLIVGLLVVMGLDKVIESGVLEILPDVWIDFTTIF